MDADDFRDYMLSFLFLRYLSDNYEAAARRNWAATTPSYRWRAMTAACLGRLVCRQRGRCARV